MPKKLCCCDVDDYCLTNQFVTIFGPLLDSAVPVSPGDLISLKINRPPSRTKNLELIYKRPEPNDTPCPTCCTYCSPSACSECPPVLSCNNNRCGAGGVPEIPSASESVEFGGACRACCPSICEGACDPSTDPTCPPGPDKKRQNSSILSDNSTFNVSQLFKKLINRGTQTPINYGTSYNIKTVEELIQSKNKKAITNNLTIPSNQANNLIQPPSLNELFKQKLDNLYPVCKQCLIDNGYDIDCIRNNSFDCKDAKIDFCKTCQKECQVYCSGYYGDTSNQRNNIKQLFGTKIYTDNYDLASGTTFNNSDLYNGNLLINGNGLTKIIDPNETTLDHARSLRNGGAELDSILGPEPEIPDTIPADNQQPGGGGDISQIQGGDGTSSFACAACPTNGGAPGCAPLYFIYRYSGCHMVWYPPEYIFNYDVRISQGSGYRKTQSVNSSGIKTCDFLLSGSGYEEDGNGASNDIDASCIGHYFFGECPRQGCTCRDRSSYPCQCMRYPHISGGFVDTVRKKFNVSRTAFQGGYIPSQDPFAPAMRVSLASNEIGCCSCANTSAYNREPCSLEYDFLRSKRAQWPKASGLGKAPPTLGEYCNIGSAGDDADTPFYNPNYKTECFERGISPYLSRISQKLYTAARDIFHYGSTNPRQQEVLGPFYSPTIIQSNKYGWDRASFRKIYNQKSNLFHKMIGLIGMDHHFECWAYHSKALFTPAPPVAMNHCNMIITPYERPYAGQWKENSFTYDPREAFRYQALRNFPRRVMYGSSVVPLFHSDIHAMEQISIAKDVRVDGDLFDGEKFIEKFYIYFYNKITDPGDTIYNEPVVQPNDVNDYNYVSYWLKEMIRYNVISVKDHAEDIATELIELLDSVRLEPIDPENPPADNRPDPEFLDSNVESFLGKKDGYYQMINWLEAKILNDNPEANFSDKDDFTIWAALKPYVTAKLMKDNLININQKQLLTSIPGPMFAGPRRVKLWPTPDGAGLTTWGCTGDGICDTKTSVLNVTTDADPDNLLSFTSVYGGQQTWFAVTTNGKIRAFGKGSIPPGQDETAIGCSPEGTSDLFNNCNGDFPLTFDGNYFDTDVGAVPCHLSVASELAVLYNEDQNKQIVDGTVMKISSKGKFAVALVNYDEGYVPGPHLGHWDLTCQITNYLKKIYSNSGWEIPGLVNSRGLPVQITSPFSFTCREDTNTKLEHYTIKSWGKGNGGNDDADVDYGIFYDDARYVSDYWQPGCYLDDDAFGIERYQLSNKYFIWHDVAAGAKHCIAITSDGALFATPTSDNTYNQSSYGYPTVSGKRELAENRAEQNLTLQTGYYNQYPKPGYFTDDEWENLTIKNQFLPSRDYWTTLNCQRASGNQIFSENPEDGENAIPCDIRCHLFSVGTETLIIGGDLNSCGAPYGYSCQRAIEIDRPSYTQVAAGHYHSMALSDDNNLKIWGSYVKVDEDGEPLNNENSFTSTDPIPVFLPAGEIFQDQWVLGPAGGVTGCGDPNPNNSETEHDQYKVYRTADKTVFSSASIFAIDGGPDYSILARKAGNNQDRLVVWGSSEMVQAVSGVTYSGLTASYGKNYDRIDKITAGPNSIGVVYRKKNSSKRRIDIFPRPGADRGLTAGVGKNNYDDLCFTNGSVSTIYSSGSKSQTWKVSSFDTDHFKMQFENFGDLPNYFRTQAFFRAVPGRWDFSKWFFGMPCNSITSDVGDNIVGLKYDPTSVYYTKDGDKNRAFSGFPQYYWMRPAWRRIQQATPVHSYEPAPFNGCGMMRDRDGRDGLRPGEERGTGGDPNGAIASANRTLNNELGSCFGGDICWVGDGSPSAYAYSSVGIGSVPGKPFCACDDAKCGCPPSGRVERVYDCSQGPFLANSCFGYLQARNGFNSNKDYYIQSCKTFGVVSEENEDSNAGRCCGVVNTNITGFFYAKRNYYYGFNKETYLYEVQNAPIPYRNNFVGNSFASPDQIYGMTSSELINELMTPKNSIPKAYGVESTMLYPYVYVGGQALKPLMEALSSTIVLQAGCDPCKTAPPGDPCLLADTCGIIQGGGSRLCIASIDKLVGPGGWAHSYGRSICNDGRVNPVEIGGVMNTSINGSLNDLLYLNVANADDWLGPLVSFTGYTGPLPPGMTISCNCWCGDNTSFTSSDGQPCSCSRDQYPSGSCPNNDRSCPGCKFCCQLDRNLIYRVDKEYSLDDPNLYYPADKALPGLGDNDEPVPIGGVGRLYRVYEDIYSDYTALNCGGLTRGTPLCFQGNDGVTTPGNFTAICVDFGNGTPPQPIGRTSNIQCDVIGE